VRKALEELGPTFIKLGQILSTRADILPPEYIAELAKLQDQAPAVDSSIIEEIIARELGCPLEDVFATFDPVPIAAASIGQAHAATLPNGDEVIVKVRRPGVVEQIEEDLEILHKLAVTANRRWEAAEHLICQGWFRSLLIPYEMNLIIFVKATMPSASLSIARILLLSFIFPVSIGKHLQTASSLWNAFGALRSMT